MNCPDPHSHHAGLSASGAFGDAGVFLEGNWIGSEARRQQGEKRVEDSTVNSKRSLGTHSYPCSPAQPEHLLCLSCSQGLSSQLRPTHTWPSPHGGHFPVLSLFISTLLTCPQTQMFMEEKRPLPTLRKE